MDAETKSQLYGGDISDHLNKRDTYKSIEEDSKNISEVYDFYVKNKKSLLDLLRLNPGEDFYDKLK